MSDALTQVEELLATTLRNWPALSGKIILTDQSRDIAPDDPNNIIRIFAVAVAFEIQFSDGQVMWKAVFEFETTTTTQVLGTICAENRTTLAHVMGALAQDRTLGGMVQDIAEIDMASVMPNGRDVGGASLQCRVEFNTSNDDWFTLLS